MVNPNRVKPFVGGHPVPVVVFLGPEFHCGKNKSSVYVQPAELNPLPSSADEGICI